MGRILMDFKCGSCDNENERFIDASIREIECPNCGKVMTKIIGTPKVVLDGTNPDFPGAYDKWARTREQNARVKSKRDRE